MNEPNRGSCRRPIDGIGVGLRAPHYHTILEQKPAIPWFEVLIDNYFCQGGPLLEKLERVCRDYPLTFHSVGLSLGGSAPLNMDYLRQLRALIEHYRPAWVSDHLCWNTVDGYYMHDLLPLPYLEQVARHVADHIKQVQDYLGQRILLENVSSYLSYQVSAMTEWAFVNSVIEQADCDLLLDINNIYVSARNHGFDPSDYLQSIPAERVKEIHLAGYEDEGTHLLDTHGRCVQPPVWALYRQALQQLGPIPTLIEWDNNIPAFGILQAEADKATRIYREEANLNVA